jgi:site-specific DNA recombinase
MNPTKVILIARVSDVEQRKALPAQKQRLENYARQLGYQPDYYEFDESAYKDARQKFSQLVETIRALDDFAIIVFDKIDRFTRDASQAEVRAMGSLVEKDRIEMHFPSDNLVITKNSPATDLFRLGIGMLLAKYYSDASRDNVRRRFEQMLNDGIWVHKAPLGYKNIKVDEKTKDIAVDPEKSHYVIKAFELRAMGLPYELIAKELNNAGFTTKAGKKATRGFMERVLNNKFYYGVMVHSGREYPHKYEPLISRGLFNQCQAVRDKRKHEKTKYDSKDFTLKKIVKCGYCGRACSPFKARNTVYLRCASGGKCGNSNTAESLVIDGVAQDVAFTDIPASWLDKVIAELRNRHDNQQLYYTQNIELTRKEYDAIKEKMKMLYHDRLTRRITPHFHDEIANDLEKRQQELNAA